jgi:hypothetical protein
MRAIRRAEEFCLDCYIQTQLARECCRRDERCREEQRVLVKPLAKIYPQHHDSDKTR